MAKRQYTELLKAYTNEFLASMIKVDMRSRFHNLMQVCIARSLIIFKEVSQ